MCSSGHLKNYSPVFASSSTTPREDQSTCPTNVSIGMSLCRRRTRLDRHGFFLFDSLLHKGACFTSIQKLLSLHATEKLDQFRDPPGPSGLVAGSQARAVVPVEVLEEQQVILPLGIGLELRCIS